MAPSPQPRLPQVNIRLRLDGPGGNAFVIIGDCMRAMRAAEVSHRQQEQFLSEATDGDYDHLLRTVREWFAVDE